MNNNEARKFVEAVYHDIWAAHNLKKFDDYYHPEVNCLVYQPNGVELEMDYTAIKNWAHSVAKTRHKVITIFEEVIAEEDKIIARYHHRAPRIIG